MKRFLSLFVCSLAALTASAHNIYTIYPTPQNQYGFERTASFTQQVNIVVESQIDQTTIDRAVQVLTDHGFKATVSNSIAKSGSNLLLGVAGSKGTVDRHVASLSLDRSVFALDEKYDRHLLTLTGNKRGEAQVVIQIGRAHV